MRVQHNVDLGEDERGLMRKAALVSWAEKRRLLWGKKGSISRLMQRIADEIISKPEGYGLTREKIESNK